MIAFMRDRLWQIVLLAIAYLAIGKLALLLLDFPNGQIAPLWPPAGLALGAMLLRRKLWPGIWLGSFLGKIQVVIDSPNLHEALRFTLLHGGIGLGATAQALVGAWLIKRFVGHEPSLTTEGEVGKFLMLCGPVACLISPTCTMILLSLAHMMPTGAWPEIWVSWWVGGIIGMYLFAPLTICWLSKESYWRTRRRAMTASLLLMCIATMLVFGTVNRTASRAAHQRFEHDTMLMTAALQRRADVGVEMVRALVGLFAASDDVDGSEFSRFSAALVWDHTEVEALFWAPRAANEPNAYPVQYIESAVDTGLSRAADIASDAEVREAIQRSADRGAVISLTRKASKHSYLLLAPFYDRSLTADAAASERRAHLQGFVGAIVDIDKLATEALADVPDTSHLPWQLEPGTGNAAAGARPAGETLHAAVLRPLQIADHRWQLRFEPETDYMRAQSQVAAWIVLGAGLAFTVLVVGGALVVTGRTMTIQAEVQARTEELARINSKLADEVCDHIRTEEALGRERELLKAVFDNLSEGIIVMNASHQITMANRAAHSIHLRVAGAAALLDGRWQTRVRTYSSDGVRQLPIHEVPIIRALRGETVRDMEVLLSHERRPQVRVVMTAQPLLSLGTHQPGAIAIVRDITDVHKVERLKREFVATVSHELRTPLTSIRGSLGLLSSGGLYDGSKAQRLIDMAVRNTERLTFLINDLLDIEKIEQGGMKFDFSEQSLEQLVQHAVEAQQGHAQSCNVRIRIAGDAPMRVLVDPQRLLQVLANLLSNAVKFSPSGGEILVQRTQRDGRCRVTITDQGPGVAAEFRDRLFEKFSQADSSDARAKGGTGLGLAISKALIEHMGGGIGFDSEAGHGATFYFELPVVNAATKQALSEVNGEA